MKKNLITILLLGSLTAFAQTPWDNNSNGIHYIDGLVGIGAALPENILHIAKDDGGSHANRPILIIQNTGTSPNFHHRASIWFTGI